MSNSEGSSSTTPIASSNVGFQLLKKHGWKEGTGLGVSEQVAREGKKAAALICLKAHIRPFKGRLEPVQTYLKKNKRGLGAETKKPRNTGNPKSLDSIKNSDKLSSASKGKGQSKKMKKAAEIEKLLQEKEFERAFFREFWPNNV